MGGTDKTRVLYVFGGAEQITLNVAAKTWTGLRHYQGPDGTVVTRTSAGAVSYQLPAMHGTTTTSVDAVSLIATRRYFDPYGNARGPKPGSWVSPDENRGFVGQPLDAAAGLNLLGARDYDAVTGRFLSADPVFQAGDPNQMGGYTYAADNPASSSDPSGLDDWYNDPTMNKCVIDCGPQDTTTTTTTTVTTTTTTSSGGGGDDDDCDGFWDCAGDFIEKVAPVIVVVLVVVVVVVAATACTAESGGLLGPACIEGAGMAFAATCGAMLGDCGPGPGGEGLSETAREDSSAGTKGAAAWKGLGRGRARRPQGRGHRGGCGEGGLEGRGRPATRRLRRSPPARTRRNPPRPPRRPRTHRPPEPRRRARCGRIPPRGRSPTPSNSAAPRAGSRRPWTERDPRAGSE